MLMSLPIVSARSLPFGKEDLVWFGGGSWEIGGWECGCRDLRGWPPELITVSLSKSWAVGQIWLAGALSSFGGEFLLAGPIRGGSFGVWSWAFLVTWVSRSNHGSSVCQGKSWVLVQKDWVWAHEDLGPALG
ncbi:unnamed protein product [Prunus armeniaca]|uniref:Uncharacterized protein n=1 Tax=Prunus armeniaca TaxID=36596 RepID=A0A6J5WUU5_PRUAR|nr:unnamed protein product [Prunus armeniaca]